MSFDAFLIHTCSIDRPTPSGTGRYGQTTLDASTRIADEQACRLVERMERTIDARTGEFGWVQQTRLYLQADAVVGTMLRPGDIVEVEGFGIYVIRQAMWRNRMTSVHHIMAILESYNPPG